MNSNWRKFYLISISNIFHSSTFSGGATVASRLADNRKWKVLLLEAGSREGVINQIPIAVSSLQLTDYNWGYTVQPQKKCCLGMNNRQCAWPRGKALGGTSTLYYMIHTRGHKLDYDEWEALGNSGWGYESILPYFKKSERFRGPGNEIFCKLFLKLQISNEFSYIEL